MVSRSKLNVGLSSSASKIVSGWLEGGYATDIEPAVKAINDIVYASMRPPNMDGSYPEDHPEKVFIFIQDRIAKADVTIPEGNYDNLVI